MFACSMFFLVTHRYCPVLFMLAEYALQLAYYASRIKELKISISTVNYQMLYTRLSGEALTRAKTMMRYEIDQFQLPTYR